MEGLGFAEAAESLRSLKEFVVRTMNSPVSSRAVCRAIAVVDYRARALLRQAPIKSPADAIAALRFVYEWHEQCDDSEDTYTELFERALKFIERHVAATTGRV